MQPEVTIRPSDISNSVTKAVLAAFYCQTTKLPPEILTLPGMSGQSYRRFINNLMATLPSYMEVGSWVGSTLCSAIHGNNVTALAIDDWSEFDGPSWVFLRHLSACKGKARVSFIERDCRKIDYGKLAASFEPFAVYLFDGPHDWWDQYHGIIRAQPMLAPCYVQIVDDWNFARVRQATRKAISDLNSRVALSIEVRTTLNDEHAPEPTQERSDWHNGVFIAVVEKAL